MEDGGSLGWWLQAAGYRGGKAEKGEGFSYLVLSDGGSF